MASSQKTAFLTGANVGQSNLLVKALADQGWRVFAGVLPGAPTDLVSGSNITLVEQDVSRTDSVQRSAEIVQAALGDRGLDLLMNIAGVANIGVGVVEGINLGEMERLFHINTFGMVRVIQAFLPMLRRSAPGSRIANYSSGAILSNPIGAGSYNMTKYAIYGLTMTLRHELAPFGMQVTSIIPGGVLTAMSANAHANTKVTWNKQPEAVRRVYGPYLERTMCQVLPDFLESKGSTPEQALAQTLKILALKKWKPMHYVGNDVKPMGLMKRLLSEQQLEAVIRRIFQIPVSEGRQH